MATSKKRSRRNATAIEMMPSHVVNFQSDRLREVAQNITRALTANGLEGDVRIQVRVNTRQKGKADEPLVRHRHNTRAQF